MAIPVPPITPDGRKPLGANITDQPRPVPPLRNHAAIGRPGAKYETIPEGCSSHNCPFRAGMKREKYARRCFSPASRGQPSSLTSRRSAPNQHPPKPPSTLGYLFVSNYQTIPLSSVHMFNARPKRTYKRQRTSTHGMKWGRAKRADEGARRTYHVCAFQHLERT